MKPGPFLKVKAGAAMAQIYRTIMSTCLVSSHHCAEEIFTTALDPIDSAPLATEKNQAFRKRIIVLGGPPGIRHAAAPHDDRS